MNALTSPNPVRSHQLFTQLMDDNARRTSRVFLVLMFAQWAYAIVVSLVWSPYAWAGKTSTIHVHVIAALVLGAAISSLPVAMLYLRPTSKNTQYTVALGQMLWSALLIHLTGGRIETHFHVFGSLAFLAFYRDWRVVLTGTVVVVIDHLLRGIYWPESVYGVANPEWWRFLEHAGWVVFEDAVLILGCIRGVNETRTVADRQALAEALTESERTKSVALAEANHELTRSRDALAKLAEVGQLAASVGHELRNPLAAVRNGLAYVSKRTLEPRADQGPISSDPRFAKFIEMMDVELQNSSRIVSDLLDFARDRAPELRPCPLAPLVADAIAIVPSRTHVRLINDVSPSLPIPSLDKDQIRQALANLIQNAAEAIPAGREGAVTVSAMGGDGKPWLITVTDDGTGIPEEIRTKIFQPLFTTKTKGTGLGLAIVHGLVRRHGGTIKVDSQVGKGTTFTIELPAAAAQAA